MSEYKCNKCEFVCYSTILFAQHEKRCATGLSEADYKLYLREREGNK